MGTGTTGYSRGEPGDGAFKAAIFIASLFKDSELAASEAAAHAAVGDDEQALAIAAGQAAKGNTATAQQIAAVVLGAASVGGKGKKRKSGGQNSQGHDNGKDAHQNETKSSTSPNEIGSVEERKNTAQDRVGDRVERMRGKMKEGEKRMTTFAVAEVITKDGQQEVIVAGAGRSNKVPPRLLEKGDKIARNSVANGDVNNRLNDAEQKIMRQVSSDGSSIEALGATRDMCPSCQSTAEDAKILNKVVTPLEGRKS